MKRGFLVHTVLILAAIFISFLVMACGGDDDDDSTTDASTNQNDGGSSEDSGNGEAAKIFGEPCQKEGAAYAAKITTEGVTMTGPDAIGRKGDFLLMNSRAAFIIQGMEQVNSYYCYGGIPVDAVALDNCAQASPERFQEIGVLMGKFNATDYYQSVLHAFRADKVEVVNDGSDGKDAIVRATGTDDYFWTVEDQLIRESYADGTVKAISDLFELAITIDYILPADSNVLKMEIKMVNTKSEKTTMIVGVEILFGTTTTRRYYSNEPLTIADYTLDRSVPWVVSSNGDGAWAFAMYKADMTTLDISGLTAVIDANQILKDPLKFSPAGEEGDSNMVTYFLSVGPTDSNSAVKHLKAVNSEPMARMFYDLFPIEGKTYCKKSGNPLEGALINLEAENQAGNWQVLDSFYSRKDGTFSGEIPDFGHKTMNYRFVAYYDGRPSPEPVPVSLTEGAKYEIGFERSGTLHYEIKDETGTPIPSKILLYQNGEVVKRIFSVSGSDDVPMIPGNYDVSVTRGYEYATYSGKVTVEAEKTVELVVTLEHAVNTEGFMSVDTHCHAARSPDNVISIAERIASVAAEGLDVIVSTDHEFIGSWQEGIDSDGLQNWVATVVGQEVTAPIPEHTNIYPVEPDYDLNARGGYVKWYQKDIAEIYEAEWERGAEIVALNHPREFLNLIQFNTLTGEPDLKDPTVFGFGPNASLWSWNFITVELMNDPEFIFINPGSPDELRLFDAWMSFLNHGHRITAVGVSDAHDYAIPGRPRNFFMSSTDKPAEFKQEDLVDAMKNGRSEVSVGAFARVQVNGTAGMGDTITDTDGEVDLSVHIEAIPEIDITYFKVYVNCDQVAAIAADDPSGVVKYDDELKIATSGDSHIVVCGFGESAIPAGLGDYSPYGTPRVTTNPIFIDTDGNGKFDAPGGKACVYDLDPPK